MSGAGEPVEIRGSRISHGLFEILRVAPQLGRTFTADEDRPDEDAVVILGHDLWQRNFGGNPNIVGQKIVISNRPRTVVGVMPRAFRFPEISELWVPLALTTQMFTRTDHGLNAVARLKDGVTFNEAQAEMNNIAARIEQQHPVTNEGLGVKVTSLHDNLAGDYREALLILLGVVGCVLLVACVNVANLILARATARQKESPAYFRTMRITLLAGRDFTSADTNEAQKVTIIDERLAGEYWPNESAVGKRIRFGPPEDDEPWHTAIIRSPRHVGTLLKLDRFKEAGG